MGFYKAGIYLKPGNVKDLYAFGALSVQQGAYLCDFSMFHQNIRHIRGFMDGVVDGSLFQ